MPDFSKARVSTGRDEELSEYRTFLKRLQIGQVVTLPLSPGESTRAVMRALNTVAQDSNMRLARLPSDKEMVRFRVLSPEKRAVNLTEEVKTARVEKAKATRARRRQEATA